MLKFIPGFSCWKLSPEHILVIASCAKTHEVRLYVVRWTGDIEDIASDAPMPDIRTLVPCRWHGLSAVQRAVVRDRFHQTLIDLYGEETYMPRLYNREIAKCD